MLVGLLTACVCCCCADVNADYYGTQVAINATYSPQTIQDCLNYCDDDTKCAGVYLKVAVTQGTTAQYCKLVYGDDTLGVFTRTMLRTSLSRLIKPAQVRD